jgi:hypothetical protein
MGYANHTNTDVLNALTAGRMGPPLLLGDFREADEGHWFEYAVRPTHPYTFAPADFAPDCPHIVYMNESYRFARVLKTVAWICVDEDETGQPVYEKWSLKKHNHYDTSWVRAPDQLA